MKLKTFQRQDLARASLKDGLILGWDTGLGKTWAMFLWSLLKVGYERVLDGRDGEKLRPKAPVLIIAPGDLHLQIAEEALKQFDILLRLLDSQEAFNELTRLPGHAVTNTDAEGRPIVPPGYYITSYTQLATNGVMGMPDPYDRDPRALLDWLALRIGEHQEPVTYTASDRRFVKAQSFADVCMFFAWRGVRWGDQYDLLHVTVRNTIEELDRNLQTVLDRLACWGDEKAAEAERKRIYAAYEILQQLCCHTPNPTFADLGRKQQDWVIREFCAIKVAEFSVGTGEVKGYPIGEPPPGYIKDKPETDTRPKRYVKCVYSPSLADLCWNAFTCVVVDEGVKMKGEVTLVGRGVRSLAPRYRLVLTATPVKNRLPDIFRLAWWAVGGHAEATPVFPYRDESAERDRFAATFMVTERNMTKEAEAKAEGKKSSGSRFKKFTAEVCNVHRLWKLFGPIILRRRKDATELEIVPKLRKVIRCEMGTLQKKVYRYHLEADYRDCKGNPAIGAQLQALRIAAADPSSEHLMAQPGAPFDKCSCMQTRATSASGRVRFVKADPRCPICQGRGAIPLPHRSGTAYTPKAATVLTLVAEVLERREQVVVFSAFNDPLDHFSRWLNEAQVRHVCLDGRVSQRNRASKALTFKQGRADEHSIPVMLAGVECMAEGHSFHLANNVILMAYSWAYDKFKQALDRVHRMNSVAPVNVYVVLCQGSIDRRLESLVQEKSDAAELVLDGRLIGERTEEVNLAELLKVAKREFNEEDATLDEGLLQGQWPSLRERLQAAWLHWLPRPVRSVPEFITIAPPAMLSSALRPLQRPAPAPARLSADRHDPLAELVLEPVQTPAPEPPEPPPPGEPEWKRLARERIVANTDVWANL